MKTQSFVKKFDFKHFFILWLLIMTAISCIETTPQTAYTNENEIGFGSKAVKEIVLLDNGVVDSNPIIRHVVLTLNNPENILLSYSEHNNLNKSAPLNQLPISSDMAEILHDEIAKTVELAEDGIALKPGKLACTGMNSLNVSVVYTTGDTSHFDISSTVRCDPSLYPSVWALDSIITDIYKKTGDRR